jgi:hypothetical protein
MSDLIQTPRVVVICDRALECQLIDEFVKLGVKGWTSAHCNGKGEHAILEDPFEEPDRSRVRIEMLASPATAEAIMQHVDSAKYRHRSVFAYMDKVFVSSRRNFE